MKKYPKKYYSWPVISDTKNISLSTDILSLTSVVSNNLTIKDILHLLVQQVVSVYNYPQVAQTIFLSYDSLFAYTQNKDRYHLLQELYTSVTPTYAALKSLGLLQRSSLISSWQVDYRIKVKNITSSLFSQGLLRSQKISCFWDLNYGVSIPESDVSIVPRAMDIHRIRYFIDSKKESVVLHTHTPHTIFADVALAVNPTDRRYRKMVGKSVIVPIVNKIIPIIADESIDPAAHVNGIKRITPCHDYDSSLIAQRHWLPLDVYAYDSHGIFTEHATIYSGKKAVDFFDNIIQYLQDIHNYDGCEKTLIDMPFSLTTQHYLDHFLVDGWVIHTDTILQSFTDFVQSDHCHCSSQTKEDILTYFSQKDFVPVTASHWTVRIPLMQFASFPLDVVIEKLMGTKKSFNMAMSLIIYDLWYDWFLSHEFSIEQCLDLLMSKIDKDNILLEQYCAVLSSMYPKNTRIVKDAKDLLSSFSNLDVMDEKSIHTIVDMIDTCPLIENNWSTYTIVSGFDWVWFGFLSNTFLSACVPSFLKQTWAWTWSVQHIYTYPDLSLSFDGLLLEFVISQVMDNDVANLSVISLQDIYTTKSQSIADQCIKPLSHHSLDTMRIALLSDNLSDLAASDLIVQKIWNVCRYVYMQVVASWSLDINILSDIWAFIQENWQQLTPFDQWIIYRFSEIVSKLEQIDGSMFSVQHKISHIMDCLIDDFAIKYVEIIKQRKWPLTDVVMLLCVNQLCQFLDPIMPDLIGQIRTLFGNYIAWSYDVRTISLPSKNYKIHLLMMIIWWLKKLKWKLLAKNHESVDVCIQASTDMNHFIQEYRIILDNIVRIENISFFTAEQDMPSDYIQEHVIDIVLWVKLVQQKISDTDRLYILLKEKTEYLQHLRALASLGSHPEKELKIDKLKSEIQDIEYQLVKSKSK